MEYRHSYLFCGLLGVAAGVLLAPKAGAWHRYLANQTKEGRKMITGHIKETEAAVNKAADGIVDILESGRQAIAG